MRRRVRGAAGLVAAGLVLCSCGDGASDPAVAADGAVLGVLEPGVDVSDEPVDVATAEFRAGEDGEVLVVADVVRTDPSGFAEVAWFGGALARVDADSTYSLTTFDATPDRAVVVTELEAGRIWNRLREGAAATYEVRTDVGTAAVRGTAFWVACDLAVGCTFAVLEGTVVVEADDGSQILLGPGEEVTIGSDGTPGAVTRTDTDDAWVARNAELDLAQGFTPLPAAEGSSGGDAVVLEYFTAFGTRTEEERSPMLERSAPGSAAHDFAVYWTSLAAVDPNSFTQDVTLSDGVVEACIPEGEGNARDQGCVTYRDIVLDDATGRVAEFSVGTGRIADRVVVGDGTRARAEDVMIELVAAHQRTNLLTVLWSTTNDGDTELALEARLLTPSGEVVTHEGFTGHPVPAGASVRNAINLPYGGLDGTLQVRLPSGTVLEVAIPTA